MKGKVSAGDGALGRTRDQVAGMWNGGKRFLPAALSCCNGTGASEKPLKAVTAAEGLSLPCWSP